MSIKLDSGSRFYDTPVILATASNGELVETYGVWKLPSFIKTRPNDDQIGKLQIQTGRVGRPDLIAADLYGSQYLDWILIAFNNTLDVLNWPQAGTIIEYPLPGVVFAEIN